MSYKIKANPCILNYTSKDYAGNTPQGDIKIDCSLGVNPDLLGDCIFQCLHEFRQKTGDQSGKYTEIKYYPHGESIKDALAGWYQRNNVGTGWLSGDNFIMGNGSYNILCALNLLCLTGGKKVLGHAPQFTAYIDHVNCSGSNYQCYYLNQKDNYKFHAQAYIDCMTADYDLFIVENPNNPTGQVIALHDIRKIAQRAKELDRILVIDEAYAEYMPFSNSAINLITDFPQVIVTRSFSKGWGMAGLRLGYAVAAANSDLLPQLEKLVLPFNSNGIARALAETALQSKLEHPDDPFGIQSVTAEKAKFLEAVAQYNQKLGKQLRVAETSACTPIMMLYYNGGEQFHLQKHLMQSGILTVSCETYIGLDGKAVRLMLPERASMPLLLELLEKAVAALPEV